MVSTTKTASVDGSSNPAEITAGHAQAWWLAVRSLFSQRTRGRTFFALALIALSLTVALVPLALSAASRSARELALRKRPLCIWVGDRILSDQVTPERLAQLRHELQTRLGEAAPKVREFPFDEFSDYRWVSVQKRGREALELTFEGRTMAATDPLWGRMTIRGQGRPPGPGEAGVIVTLPMFNLLVGAGNAADELQLVLPTANHTVTVPVLCVVEEDAIPSGHSFAFDPDFEWTLRRENPDLSARSVTSGEVDPKWAEVARLSQTHQETLRKTFQVFEVRWPPYVDPRTQGGQCWRLRSTADEEPRLSEWRHILLAIRKSLLACDQTVPPSFVEFVAPDNRQDFGTRDKWNRLTLSTDDPALLLPMAQAADAVGLPYYDVVVKQMQDIDREGQIWAWVNLAIGTSSMVLAALLLFLIARSRVSEQRPIIGMLKAMGGSDTLFLRVHLLESVLLWIMGAVLGATLSLVGVVLLSWGLSWGTEVWREVVWPWLPLLAVFSGSLLICILSSVAATLTLAAGSPIQLIRTK